MNHVFLCGFNSFSQIQHLQNWFQLFIDSDKIEKNIPRKQTIITGESEIHGINAKDRDGNLVPLSVLKRGDHNHNDDQHAVQLTKVGTLDDSVNIEDVQITWSRIGVTVSTGDSTAQGHQHTVICGHASQHQQQQQQQETLEALQLRVTNCRLRASTGTDFLLQQEEELLLLREDTDQVETLRVVQETQHDTEEELEESACTYTFGTVSGTATEFVASYDSISVGKLSNCTRHGKSDQSGNRSEGDSRLMLTCLDSGLSVQLVSCGLEHSMFLTTHGSVLTCGSGSRGQLGHGSLEDEQVPRVVSALEGVKCTCVAAGGWHSAAITECGDLFMWGWNESGQLGLPSPGLRPVHSHTSSQLQKQHQEQQQKSCDRSEVCKAASLHLWPQQVEVVAGDRDSQEDVGVCKVACGSRHTAILTETGEALTTGWNSYRQLGLQHTNSVDQFTPVSFGDKSMTVTQLWCGAWNTMFVVKESSGM